jgi:nucleotide-binding universal stress UspA family protein
LIQINTTDRTGRETGTWQFKEHLMYKRIMVAVDGSPTSNQALDAAIGLARTFGSRLRLIHVVNEMAHLSGYDQFGFSAGQLLKAMTDAGNAILHDAMARAAAAGIEVDCMLFNEIGERLGETVATAAKLWNADLIVAGSHGRKGLGRMLMGSGADQIIRVAPVPVLVVKPPQEQPNQTTKA